MSEAKAVHTQHSQRKVIYSSYHLAYRARLKILEKVVHFDVQKIGMVEGEQIKEAIKNVLGEQTQEVEQISQKLIKDCGKIVKYEDIVNACLEEGLRISAAEKIKHQIAEEQQKQQQSTISQGQFLQILGQPLTSLGLEIQKKEITDIFEQIPKIKSGRINLDQFIIFTKEYFGTKCLAGDKAIQPQNTKTIGNQEQYKKGVERIGRLLWPQFKNLIIKNDISKNLMFSGEVQIDKIQKELQIKLQQGQGTEYTYNQILKNIIVQKFKRYQMEATNKQGHLNKQQFVGTFTRKQVNLLPNKPSLYLLEEIFEHMSKGRNYLSSAEYLHFLTDVAKTYEIK